ncbi:MAG: hypothetical protein P1P76_05715 [Anaerolineales bacterium]|nr:hypothetical protein [Anaerolineales bacterium]
MILIALSDTHGMHRPREVPDGDILIHAGDLTIRGDSAGCQDLFEAVEKIKPVFHIFGHIHEG